MHYSTTLFRFMLIVLVVTLVVAGAGSSSLRVVDAGSHQAGQQDSGEGLTDQIIIKYKASADTLGAHAPAQLARMSQLNAIAGVPLKYVREMSDSAHVLRLSNKLPISQVRTITAKLMTLDDIEYAEPDRILQHTLTPNDPQYTNQWHYYDTWGINAPGAWDITTGSASIVVAVVDTGITNHADLAGRTVAGYDFINDSQVANDGDGRDSDPSDPGDWITSAESSSGYFQGCTVTNSSWHGTHVAGTIGAASNNGLGVTGINWVSKILPVRVLGKCGGYTSDIIDGMRWAAGLSVTGVPANSHPARVINMSLGGSGACSTAQQTAMNEITAAGTVVVVAAGNSNADASGFNPGNCNNVITVAATNRSGNRAYYSNYGSLVEISAPGGDTSISGNGVLSTLNTGTQGPVADTYAYYQGTSMATPHVTGVASLVLSVKPSLTPAQVLQVLQNTARAFPVGGSCNTSNCGAGIVDAAAAVSAVNGSDVSIVKQVIGSNFAPGDPITFTLSIANTGNDVAADVIVTDVMPSQVLNPTFDSSLPITPTGLLSYVWNVGTLGIGQSGVITLYGQIDPGLASGFSFTNIATISDPQDNTSSNNSSSVVIGAHKVYLPVIANRWPPVPDVPTLNTIADYGSGDYDVSWNSANRADLYILQESTASSFSSPTRVYSGTSTLWSATSKAVGAYYYRVKAHNSYGDSGWSNIQSITVVSGPKPGFWQGSGVEFYVTTDRASVSNFAIYVTLPGCGSAKITSTALHPISNDQFSFSGSFYASGTFDSTTAAHGTTGLSQFGPVCGYYWSGGPFSWSANWSSSAQSAVVSDTAGPVTVEPVPFSNAYSEAVPIK